MVIVKGTVVPRVTSTRSLQNKSFHRVLQSVCSLLICFSSVYDTVSLKGFSFSLKHPCTCTCTSTVDIWLHEWVNVSNSVTNESMYFSGIFIGFVWWKADPNPQNICTRTSWTTVVKENTKKIAHLEIISENSIMELKESWILHGFHLLTSSLKWNVSTHF